MVDVVDMQDFAFMGRWRYNPPREIDSNQSSEENEEPAEEHPETIQE